MAKLNATQRNYLYLTEASRTGIHKPILAALYETHQRPVLADGEVGLGLSSTNAVLVTDLDTLMKQVQFGANTIRSLVNRLLAQGSTGDTIWDRSLGRYSDRLLQAIAQGFVPDPQDAASGRLAASDFNTLKAAYLRDIETTFDGSRVAQNLAFLDKALVDLAQRIPTYYNGSAAHRQAALETIRLWRRLNTQREAIQSLVESANGGRLTDSQVDDAIKRFFQTLSPFYGGLPHQREALLRLTQLWRGLETRDGAIASLETSSDPGTAVQIVDPALLSFARNVSLFFQSKLDQRLAILEGIRLWRGVDSRSAVLSQLGVNPRVFEKDALPPDVQTTMLQTLDRGLVEFTGRVPDAYQESPQQREALLRMFQIWRRLRTRQETLQALFSELEKLPGDNNGEDDPVGDGEVRLSRNFTLGEMTRSDTADRFGLANTPTPAEVENLRKLCNQILQPARDALGPLFITSGFRSAAVNRAVGGVPNSDHRLGYAADVVPGDGDTRRFAEWVRDNVPFDQVILEGGTAQRPSWIHISANPRNRKQYFRVANP